jgi:excisionase family DNA binding protein
MTRAATAPPAQAGPAAPAALTPPFGYPGDARKWVAAANEIAARLADGTYPPGQWLPLNADIAAATGYGTTTVSKALAAAARHELVTRVRGKGTYAGTGPQPPEIPPRLARDCKRHAGLPRPRRAPEGLPGRLAEDYLTIAQIARIIRVDRRTITKLVDEGAFDGAIRVGSAVRVPARSADAYLATCLITPAGVPARDAP